MNASIRLNHPSPRTEIQHPRAHVQPQQLQHRRRAIQIRLRLPHPKERLAQNLVVRRHPAEIRIRPRRMLRRRTPPRSASLTSIMPDRAGGFGSMVMSSPHGVPSYSSRSGRARISSNTPATDFLPGQHRRHPLRNGARHPLPPAPTGPAPPPRPSTASTIVRPRRHRLRPTAYRQSQPIIPARHPGAGQHQIPQPRQPRHRLRPPAQAPPPTG